MPRPILAACAALVVVLAGCAVQTQGVPSAADERRPTATGEEQGDGGGSPGASEAEGEGDQAGLQPCELIDAAGLASLGLTEQTAKVLGEARVCQWRREGATIGDSFTASIALFGSRGLAEIVGNDIQTLPDVGSHEAKSFVAPAGSCGVSLGVGADSRVDSLVTGGDDPREACRLAAELAALAEPNLP